MTNEQVLKEISEGDEVEVYVGKGQTRNFYVNLVMNLTDINEVRLSLRDKVMPVYCDADAKDIVRRV